MIQNLSDRWGGNDTIRLERNKKKMTSSIKEGGSSKLSSECKLL